MTHVLVTGGSGKLGRACVRDLIEHGYDVTNVDLAPPPENLCPQVRADLTDFGQALEALAGVDERPPADAVVHLAAIPAPGLVPNAEVFRVNTLSTYNVFEAARRLGIKNVVWASSETVLGLPFDTPPPYMPIDETFPRGPESAYSLSKLMGETMAEQFCRWDPDAEDLRAALLQRDGAGGIRKRSPASTPTPASANGTSGATSTPATAPRRSAERSRPSAPAQTSSSSPTPTPS